MAKVLIYFSLSLTILSTWKSTFGKSKPESNLIDSPEWTALGTLSSVKSAWRLTEEYCDPQSQNKTVPSIPGRPSSFVQSDYLPWPENVNIFEQMCLVSQGMPPSTAPCTNDDFSVSHETHKSCWPPDQSVDLLILIDSYKENTRLRWTIRHLWGNRKCWLGASVKFLFLVDSISPTGEADPEIVEESENFQDIIQQQFVSGTNVSTSYKLLLAFRWHLAYCPQAKWLLFVTDDQFVNPFNVISFLLSVSEAMRQRLVVGSVWYEPYAQEVHPLWQRTERQTSNGERYPTFVATPAMLVSSVLAPSIYITMRFTQLAEHSDLFMAHVLRKLFILPAHFHDFYAYDRQPETSEQYERAIVFYAGDAVNQTKLWKSLECGKYCT